MIFFRHYVGMSTDPKIIALRKRYGSSAIDAYWCILEFCGRNERPFYVYLQRETNESRVYESDMRLLCHSLNIECDMMNCIIESMIELGLLEKEQNDNRLEVSPV